jgi:putative endonuclease
MASSHRRGLLAERRVALKYEQLGFVILDRNWRCNAGELDVVALRGSTLAVVEVKWRRSNAFGGAISAVGPLKQSRIRAATEAWLVACRERSQRADLSIRFDVAAVTGGTIEIFERAFE